MATDDTDQSTGRTAYFVDDALGGTLARDHQSRGMYFEGEHRRTYVTYMDDDFYARVTYYDHDADEWIHPVLVDDCIGPDGLKDGHNVPNIFAAEDGTIHLLYGSHGHRFKHAYTDHPENIEHWKTGMRVGDDATYPFFADLRAGELLLFYRYGPEGGYDNPFLAVQRSTDHGRTWNDRIKLVTWPTGCKISRATYDPVEERVHLMLWMPGSEETASVSPYASDTWRIFHCAYDPESGNVTAVDGTPLGPLARDEDFVEDDPIVSYGKVGEFVLHDGVPYFLLRVDDGSLSFTYWDGQELVARPLPEDTFEALSQNLPVLYTDDGREFWIYGISTPDSEKFNGGSLLRWMSPDRGASWSDGERLIDHTELGHGFDEINEVMNYPGDGPYLLASEPTDPWPEGWVKNEFTHYDNPSRRDKRIYAVNFEGEFVGRRTDHSPNRERDSDVDIIGQSRRQRHEWSRSRSSPSGRDRESSKGPR